VPEYGLTARWALPAVRRAATAAPATGLTAIVREAQQGDRAAFEALYREHVGRVYAICLRLTGDRGRAEELTQDVFVRTWERIWSFRGQAAFGTWLHRLAVNEVLMALRAERRRDRRIFGGGFPETPATGPTPGAAIDLERAIAALPPGAREVFVLHDVEGYRHAEIAKQVGIAPGTSKAQLFRARRLLRKWLDR